MRPPEWGYQRLIVGYHGCEKSVAERVLMEGEELRPSQNTYDWLGKGVYFWEYGPRRAWDFAFEQKERGKLETPFVLGAYIHLGRCFDLADVYHTEQLRMAWPRFKGIFEAAGKPLPENKRGQRFTNDILLRYRDCAYLNWYLEWMDAEYGGTSYYQTVRGVFVEGEAAYEGSGFQSKNHLQIAVRDPSCILGYFRPRVAKGEKDEQPTGEKAPEGMGLLSE
ncbi:hypothetical protein L6R29_25715 [Myxococcota bacterium]|nr:hypothetical protein [Myxococcota bacterium]